MSVSDSNGHASRSFLDELFDGVPSVNPSDRELDRLRLENRSLRAQLATARTASRLGADALRRLLSDLETVMGRATAKPSPVLLQRGGELTVYQLAAGIKPDKPQLDGPIGREIIGHVVEIMTAHFWDMVEHVNYRYLISVTGQKVHTAHVMLANLLIWVFGVGVPDWDKFSAPKSGMTLSQEVSSFLRAAMAVRSYHTTQNKFPIALLYTFIVNWNSFAAQQIDLYPLPLDPHLGLSALPLEAMQFPFNLECECAVYRPPAHKTPAPDAAAKKTARSLYSIRLYLLAPVTASVAPVVRSAPRLLRNSPAAAAASYSSAVGRALTLPGLSLSAVPVPDEPSREVPEAAPAASAPAAAAAVSAVQH